MNKAKRKNSFPHTFTWSSTRLPMLVLSHQVPHPHSYSPFPKFHSHNPSSLVPNCVLPIPFPKSPWGQAPSPTTPSAVKDQACADS